MKGKERTSINTLSPLVEKNMLRKERYKEGAVVEKLLSMNLSSAKYFRRKDKECTLISTLEADTEVPLIRASKAKRKHRFFEGEILIDRVVIWRN